MIEWKDVTSYSKGTVNRVPDSFALESGALRIVVTRAHIFYRPEWVMHCFALNIDTKPLTKGLDEAAAKAEAIQIAANRLARLTCDLAAISEEPTNG